ncbi:hypothetical protein NBRC3280_3383 [Acetobacter pasteurianus NBRC 3280]|uniref:Uncharacterized protein n=1 Tax=Acetobacter pasteurianus NBRC 3278 TaxID=1226660 RepID=A0A401X9C0_ACEPA|nr:hypothetical protein NBRC3277_3386 [Acetobacter pasteurianus NBRC 3277]GCD64416.1 hypothetical protein NBRC3278_3509 [Acetobacter pasteurianus NBRC 3278]GCD70748.1 hypothetical protein NBRC3280_3383 [Acetobacter pasteurianus NBRC 3280]
MPGLAPVDPAVCTNQRDGKTVIGDSFRQYRPRICAFEHACKIGA